MAQSREIQLPENIDTPEKKLGDILREERERQGLDFVQVSEMTRLRPHVLESLEKEEWDIFSAPVFVKGFLRAYAEALHLDAHALLNMYDNQNPPVDSAPHPLSSLSASHTSTSVFFLLLILLAAAVFFALHYISKKETKGQIATVPQFKTQANANAREGHVETAKKKASAKFTEGFENITGTVQKKIQGRGIIASQNKQPAPVAGQKQTPAKTVKAPEPPQAAVARPVQKSPATPAKEPTPPAKPLVLKAKVRETTWVKIILDQGNPKEYIFQPGSRPEWKAEQGFELFIGNAGGIALEFDGKKMDNLGGHGKVIHLTFPRKEERDTRD